ncbi:MAG: tetratricopeptide repeat protein [Alphaproteobacteria bacterium]
MTRLLAIAVATLYASIAMPAFAAPVDDLQAGIDAAQQNEHDKAIDFYTKAIKAGLPPRFSAAALANRAASLTKQGKHDDAIADATEALKLRPDYGLAFFNRGTAQKMAGRCDKAIPDFAEAIRLDPKDAAAFNNRAGCLIEAAKLDEALADYSQAIQVKPQPIYHFNRCRVYDLMKQWPSALADCKKAAELDPTLERAKKLAETLSGRTN